MNTWFVKRLLQAFFSFFVVVNVSFVLVRFMPGGPMDFVRGQLMQQEMPSERIERLTEVYTNLNPTDPFWVQYQDYMSSILIGDLGESMWHSRPVSTILVDALPWTFLVMGIAILIMYTLGILIGAYLAYSEGTKLDQYSSITLTILDSIPFYVMALLLVWAFGYQLDILPRSGRYPRGVEPGVTSAFFLGVIEHALMPIVSVVITSSGLLALQMRGNSISVLGKDYVRVAQLRGLRSKEIANQYVARNAVLPLYTSFLIDVGFMFSGSVILESIFSYPGVGFYLIESIRTRDQPLMMGAFIMITVAVLIALIIADLTYSFIDPRIKGGGTDDVL